MDTIAWMTDTPSHSSNNSSNATDAEYSLLTDADLHFSTVYVNSAES